MSVEDILDNSSEAIETGTPQVEPPSSTTTEAVLGNTSNQATTQPIRETSLGNSDLTTPPPTVTEVYGHALEESKKLEGLGEELAVKKEIHEKIQEQRKENSKDLAENKNWFRDFAIQKQRRDLEEQSKSVLPQIASLNRSVEATQKGLESLNMGDIDSAKLEELKEANALNVPTSRFIDRVDAKSEKQLDEWKNDTKRKEKERLARIEDPNYIPGSRLEEVNEMRRISAEAAQERRIEAEARIMGAVTSRISSEMFNASSGRNEGERPFEANPAELKILVEQTYKDFDGIISSEDLEIGSKAISLQLKSLEDEMRRNGRDLESNESREVLAPLLERRNRIANFETEVKYKMMMLKVANVVSEGAEAGPVSAEKFAEHLTFVRGKMESPYREFMNWGDGMKLFDLYNECRRYRSSEKENFIANTVGNYADTAMTQKLIGQVPQYIADISGYSSIAGFSSKDIPRIMAFYTEGVMRGFHSDLKMYPSNFEGAISLSLALASEGKFLTGAPRDNEFEEILKPSKNQLPWLNGTLGDDIRNFAEKRSTY